MSSTGSRTSQGVREKEIGMGDAHVIGPKPTKACGEFNSIRSIEELKIDDVWGSQLSATEGML